MNWAYACLRLIGIRTQRVFRLTLRAIALLFMLCAAFWVSVLLQQGKFENAWYVYLVVVAAAFLEFVVAGILADHSFPFETERKLALMEKRLGRDVINTISTRLQEVVGKFQGCDTKQISACVHVFAELTATADQRIRKGLLQLTDYVGPDGGKKGRITLMTQGVIGRCARTGKMESVNFADARDYLDSMVRDFGFAQSDADGLTKTGRSYLAFPLHDNNQIIGVLYFFTTEPNVFPRVAQVQRLQALAGMIVDHVRLLRIA